MAHLFDLEGNRKDVVGIMQDIARGYEPQHAETLKAMMNPAEVAVQDYVDALGFQEGAWYRPAHNKLVPAAMIAICRGRILHDPMARDLTYPFSRDLVYVAQMHDSGNSLMTVEATTKGASWENVDKRWAHMGIGAGMLAKTLGDLRSGGQLEMTDSRLAELYTIAATHDFPYLGVPFTEKLFGSSLLREARGHRDADRTFVMSALSFWKDLIAQISDGKYQVKARALGSTEGVTPEFMLRARMTFFYPTARYIPTEPSCGEKIDLEQYPFDKNLEAYNEGGKVEAMFTSVGQRIVGDQFAQRIGELEQVVHMDSPQQFGELFERAFDREMQQMFTYAREGA
ncbi:hypothetical protein J4410_06115 [Candidatus Woesearchaeota archaeon]|nr:hypothetical protein [Candidatus Woesearchaeota archaeon]